jgi:hypothetical protein
MNKANLIEHLIELPNGTKYGNDFTEHKKTFIKSSETPSLYSEFLQKETNWYEQELSLLRNRIIVHSGTLTNGASVSIHTGVGFRKTYGITPLQGQDKEDFLKIKREYERRYPAFKVPENDYEMMNDFLRGIRKYKISLEKHHLKTIGRIVSNSGTTVSIEDLVSLAGSIEDFLQKCASIFKGASSNIAEGG